MEEMFAAPFAGLSRSKRKALRYSSRVRPASCCLVSTPLAWQAALGYSTLRGRLQNELGRHGGRPSIFPQTRFCLFFLEGRALSRPFWPEFRKGLKK